MGDKIILLVEDNEDDVLLTLVDDDKILEVLLVKA